MTGKNSCTQGEGFSFVTARLNAVHEPSFGRSFSEMLPDIEPASDHNKSFFNENVNSDLLSQSSANFEKIGGSSLISIS